MITIEHLHISSLRSRLKKNAIHLRMESERSVLRGLFTKGEMTDDSRQPVTVPVLYLQL